jgi:hypothetical protein
VACQELQYRVLVTTKTEHTVNEREEILPEFGANHSRLDVSASTPPSSAPSR